MKGLLKEPGEEPRIVEVENLEQIAPVLQTTITRMWRWRTKCANGTLAFFTDDLAHRKCRESLGGLRGHLFRGPLFVLLERDEDINAAHELLAEIK